VNVIKLLEAVEAGVADDEVAREERLSELIVELLTTLRTEVAVEKAEDDDAVIVAILLEETGSELIADDREDDATMTLLLLGVKELVDGD